MVILRPNAALGTSQNAAPACTELEMRMMDWLAQMLGLPHQFCFSSGLGGGGVIQATASESTLIAMLCARCQVLRSQGLDHKIEEEDCEARYAAMSRLVAYTGAQAHSSVERAALLSATRIRIVPAAQPDSAMDVQVATFGRQSVESLTSLTSRRRPSRPWCATTDARASLRSS